MRSAFGGRNARLNTSATAGLFGSSNDSAMVVDRLRHARIADVADAEFGVASGVAISVL